MSISFLVNYQYFILFLHFLIAILIAFIILVFSYLLINQYPDTEKLSSYECGFDPFGDARNPFNIHFYLVGILFIIFDLELTFLFPWACSISFLNIYSYVLVLFFLFLLSVGFIYEWIKGALNW